MSVPTTVLLDPARFDAEIARVTDHFREREKKTKSRQVAGVAPIAREIRDGIVDTNSTSIRTRTLLADRTAEAGVEDGILAT